MYTVLSHATYFMKKVTKIFVGASALLSNGALVSRIGTALLACITHDYKKPFVVSIRNVIINKLINRNR